MRKQIIFQLLRSLSSQFLLIGSALFFLLSTTLHAEVITIDPAEDPLIIVKPDEAEKLLKLQNAASPYIVSPLSPNGRYILTVIPPHYELAFLNVKNRKSSRVNANPLDLHPITEMHWVGNNLVKFYSQEPTTGEIEFIEISRKTGELIRESANLPGYPLLFSHSGEKVLCVRLTDDSQSSLMQKNQTETPPSPIERVRLPMWHKQQGPARFSYEDRLIVPVTTAQAEYVIHDLGTGELTTLLEIPTNTAIIAASWSRGDRSIGVVKWQIPRSGRGGQLPKDSVEVKDALGHIAPEDNPFLTSNSLDIFHFHGGGTEHKEIKPKVEDQAIFIDCDWDPSGYFFLAHMLTASQPVGRQHPSYIYTNGSKFQIYWYEGQLLTEVDHPQLSALYGQAEMISPWEVLVHAPYETNFTVFHYNLLQGKLTRLVKPEGSVYWMDYSPRRREIVYNFSSYTQPYEIFRQKLSHRKPIQVTHFNDELRDFNQIEALKMEFTLKNGERRVGHLIQPAGADSPSVAQPLVVWQEGGPYAPMTQEWGGSVERPFNLLPNFGISVLVTPLHGRDGFGPDNFASIANGDSFGQADIDQQVEIVDQLVDKGYTSWEKTGITGCSYGGYFSAQSITRHPSTYAAANPQCSLLNLFNEWEMGYTSLMAHLMGTSPEDEDEYVQDSPLQRAHLVETPTLLFSGDKDFLPIAYSQEFHDKINDAGTPADFWKFLNEHHGLNHPISQFTAAQAQLLWFRKYLMEEEE